MFNDTSLRLTEMSNLFDEGKKPAPELEERTPGGHRFLPSACSTMKSINSPKSN